MVAILGATFHVSATCNLKNHNRGIVKLKDRRSHDCISETHQDIQLLVAVGIILLQVTTRRLITTTP